jgi:medium-chain acyl-[acyl-carrier-protein] hydrolase
MIQSDLKSRFFIYSSDVDFQANLKPSSLVNYLIQTAWKHAENLGWGVDDLLKHNLAWVLSGLEIQVDFYPKWKEEIEIITWPKGINRLFYLRDFIFYDASGKEFGRATSSWLLIDIEKRRPKMHDLGNEIFKINLNRHSIETIIPSLKFDGVPQNQLNSIVRYSDIDVNQHLTTTRYIDLMMDLFKPGFLEQKMPSEMIMNFMKEVVFDQNICMQNQLVSNNTYLFQLITSDANKPHFICRMLF